MTENRNVPPQHQPPVKEPGPVSYLLWHLPWRLLGLFLFSIFLSIVLEYIGLTFFWPEEGWRHSQRVLLTELGWFSEDFRRGISTFFGMSPGGVVSDTLNTMHDWLMVKTGFQHWAESASQGDANLLDRTGSGLYHLLRDYLVAAVNVTMVSVLRVMVLLFTVPFFILAMFVGATEGWMHRELRRYGAAYESSFLYHHARRLIKPLFLLPWLIYLNIPFSVWPPLVLIPNAALLGTAVLVTVATFKKYL